MQIQTACDTRETYMFWQKKQKSFFDYFVEHSREILLSAKHLEVLFGEKGDIHKLAQEIKECELRGDKIVHGIIKQINISGFILPLDREDIFNFTKALDDVIDNINECAEAFAEIYMLENSTHFAQQFTSIILTSAEILAKICELIRNPSQHSSAILEHCIEIHRLENQADAIKKEALRSLYAHLKTQNESLAHYTAWSDLYQRLETITDKVEDCADITEQMVLKYS